MENKKYDWIINKSNIPYLKLDLELPFEDIFKEVLEIKDNAISQQGNNSWKGTVLHGLSSDKPRPASFYGYKDEDEAPYIWTKVAENSKFTKNWIEKTFPFEKLYRVKMNLLSPGGEIGPHVDGKKHILGVSDLTSPEHVVYITLAVEWPKDIVFNVGKHILPIKTGDAYLINFSHLHEVYNHTNKDRYSIIVMCKFGHNNKEWEQIVERSYKKFGDEYKKNKTSIKFYLKSRLISRPIYLLGRLKSKLKR